MKPIKTVGKGVETLNARTKNVSIAKETLQILKDKKYISPAGLEVDLAPLLNASVSGTVLYKEDSELPETNWEEVNPTIEVVNETTSAAAVRLISQGKNNIVALNFASARNQGGGFLSGALAQEEDLCRASGLYSCLKSKPIFYNENILCDDCYYTNNIIYSPNVPFIRDEYNVLLESPYTLSIISAPAPNLNGVEEINDELLSTTIQYRIDRILDIAERHGHKNIILGAWGCGAFGNDPEMVAESFKDSLRAFNVFEHVCFAVYDRRDPPVVLNTFNKVFNSP